MTHDVAYQSIMSMEIAFILTHTLQLQLIVGERAVIYERVQKAHTKRKGKRARQEIRRCMLWKSLQKVSHVNTKTRRMDDQNQYPADFLFYSGFLTVIIVSRGIYMTLIRRKILYARTVIYGKIISSV